MSISQEQDQINSFILKQKNTPFTQTSDEIQARNTPNGQAVFRVKTHTLQLTNESIHFLLNIFTSNAADLISLVKNLIEILILSLGEFFSEYQSVIIIPPL